MFLKRLELHGFKSFADKTELAFVPGITAVVGPNGSGKSNISDSIRWVLGEQSAKSLRGGNMQDIIFAGSDSRKPVNYGEVALTLDNADQRLPIDYNEVTVTRRIHRSGESEYFINKRACRLKDITELFMDTGVGREAYSIIGQGRIEEILSTRSEDRRGIFEEASGIVKYKTRKKETQKKLEETEQNLLRIHDLISELESQVEPLREQSEKAQTYKQLKERLKHNEIALYVHQIGQVHQSWTEANERLKQLQEQELELSTVVSSQDAHLETHRLEARKLEDDIERLQQQLFGLSEESEKTEVQREVLQERKKNLTQQASGMDDSVQLTLGKQAAAEAELTQLQSKRAELEQELARLQASIRDEEEKLDRLLGVAGEEAEARLQGELIEVLNRLAQVRNDLRHLDQLNEQSSARSGKLEEERARLLLQRQGIEERRRELTDRVEAIAADIRDARDRFVGEGETIKEKQRLLNDLEITIRKWEQKRDSLASRRDTLKELQNDYDGFQQGVREVLKAKGKPGGLQGVHGAVAELVKVPAKLETAVETALGAALQNIVMEDEAAARKAIAMLKSRHLGRATFLPLDVIKPRRISEHDLKPLAGMEGYVGVAAELVGFEPRYEGIVGNLLGNVILADNLEQANRIAARCQYRYRIVTLEGDVVHAGGSMTGGSMHKKNVSLLGRGRQVEEIERELKETDAQIAALKERSSKMQADVREANARLEELRQLGEQKRLEEQRIAADVQQLEQSLGHVEQLRLANEAEIEALASQSAVSSTEKSGLESQLAELEREEQRLQTAIREAEAARRANLSAKDSMQAQLTNLKVQAAGVQQELQSLGEQTARASAVKRELAAELERLTLLREQSKTEAEQIDAESVSLTERHNAIRIERSRLTESIEFKRAERQSLLQKIEQEEGTTKEQRLQLKQVEEQLRQAEVRVNRLDVELDNLLRKLSEEYELSYELASARYPVPEDLLGTQNLVRDLKRQIQALGDVNLGAIEEYARVHERYEFLSNQKSDLVEAKQSLYQVIKEMEAEMSKRFITTFEDIRSHFGRAFTKLFAGGRADLVLTDPSNLLETGIDIVAQPPGKKLQNLQLLSGGERALTAIALLFAILHVKPVPFCILDEVEAALDEANVSRFAGYLREFSMQTQFIVVTHRKGTMEEADVLYGVAMEEGGVSKLVSVRLDDEDAASA